MGYAPRIAPVVGDARSFHRDGGRRRERTGVYLLGGRRPRWFWRHNARTSRAQRQRRHPQLRYRREQPSGHWIDGGHIYWANDGTESIGRANLNGSDADPNWIPNLGGTVSGIAVDGSYLYWTVSSTSNYIGRVPIAGGTPDPTFIHAGPDPQGIAVQSGTIYVGVLNQIEKAPATGLEAPVPLGTSLGSGVQVPSLAVGGGYVYFGEFGDVQAIGRMTVGGLDQTGDFISGPLFAGGLATDGTYLYWSSSTDGEIGRALIGSEGATNIDNDFISEPDDPFGVAVDAGIDPTTVAISCTPTTLTIDRRVPAPPRSATRLQLRPRPARSTSPATARHSSPVVRAS